MTTSEKVKNLLDPEVLEKIVPFSGDQKDLSEAGQMLMAGRTLQRVDTGYTTAIAVQKPRSLARVVKNVLEEAELAGEDFYYGWHVKNRKTGKKTWIEGGSIGLAMCIARNYGNCATDVVPIEETPTHFMFKGYFIDLESGYTCTRLFRQRKQQSIGMQDQDRQEDIIFQIGQSKVIRNTVFNAMPRWLVNKAIATAKEAIRKGIGENLALARANALKYFTERGISQDRIEAVLECLADEWTTDHIVQLKGMATALKEGRVTIDELFPKTVNEKITEEPPAPKDPAQEEEKKPESAEPSLFPQDGEVFHQADFSRELVALKEKYGFSDAHLVAMMCSAGNIETDKTDLFDVALLVKKEDRGKVLKEIEATGKKQTKAPPKQSKRETKRVTDECPLDGEAKTEKVCSKCSHNRKCEYWKIWKEIK